MSYLGPRDLRAQRGSINDVASKREHSEFESHKILFRTPHRESKSLKHGLSLVKKLFRIDTHLITC